MFIYAIDGIDTIAGIDAIDVLYGNPYEGSQRTSGNGEPRDDESPDEVLVVVGIL